MAKAKVKSREKELQEQWLKYFKNIQKENDFIRILIKYYHNYTEPKIINFANSYDLYYEKEDLPEITDNIPVEKLRNYLHAIDITVNKLKEDAKNTCEYELEELIAHFDKHLKAFNNLEKQTKDLMPNYTLNRFESLSLVNFKGFSKENTISIKPS